MLWPLKGTLHLLSSLLVLSLSGKAWAMDVIPLYTSQKYTTLGGCCQSAPTRNGGAGILRLSHEAFGTWDVFGMSDIKWNEIALLKPVYLMGEPTLFDPTLDGISKVRRVRKYTVVWSYGGGFYQHNTRTTRFDLATLVSGLTLMNHFEFQYSLTDKLSLVGIARVGAAISFDDRGLILNPMVGLLWRL
jgi:hypothetical protein